MVGSRLASGRWTVCEVRDLEIGGPLGEHLVEASELHGSCHP